MMNAYSSPEKTAAFMEHLDKNHDRIVELRNTMKHPGHEMAERVRAFAELYHLMRGDPCYQRRLVVELNIEAEKELHIFKGNNGHH